MRLRKKKGAAEKLFGFDFVLRGLDESSKGGWSKKFFDPAQPSEEASEVQPSERKIYIELGTGKGEFISTIAEREPEINFVGFEAEPTVLYAAARKVRDKNLSNVRLAVFNVANIDQIFDEREVDRIYINFCDPWPRNKHAKRRLTNINFLDKYRRILKPDAELHFKTDNRALFDYSLEQFGLLNLDVDRLTFDLHADNPIDNIETEYEKKFAALGTPINRCVVHF